MHSKIKVNFEDTKIITILERIKEGRYAMPKIQRSYIWNASKVKFLVQSLISGYPIGCFVIWKTSSKEYETFRTETENLVIPAFKKTHSQVNFIIDGQQRMSSLYSLFLGSEQTNHKGAILPFDRMFWCPKATAEEESIVTLTKSEIQKKVRKNELVMLKALFDERYVNENKRLQKDVDQMRNKILNDTRLPLIEIVNTTRDEMKEIFVRINSGGMKVSHVDELFATTHSIDLRSKVQRLINETEYEMKGIKNLDFRIVFIMLAGAYSYKFPLKTSPSRLRTEAINKATRFYTAKSNEQEFKRTWKCLEKAFRKAVRFLKERGVNSYAVLPTDGLLVVATLFYYWSKAPKSEGEKSLSDLFWVASVRNRYSGKGYDEYLWSDILTIYKIANGKKEKFDFADQIPEKPSIFAEKNYREKTHLAKVVKCLLAHCKPKFLLSNGLLSVSEDYITSDKPEYHHIFPDSLLKDNDFPIAKRNTLMNICLLPKAENQKIGKKEPRVYLGESKKQATNRQEFDERAASHLIPVDRSSGVWEKDIKFAFEKFRTDRALMIAKKLNAISVETLFDVN